MLPHKEIVLPEIPLDPPTDTGRSATWWREYWQDCIAGRWTETVAAYEANPEDVFAAWYYLDGHPAFWRFRKNRAWTPPAHFGNLQYEGAMSSGWPEITPHKVNPATGEVEDDESLNTKLEWWYEFGPWELAPDDPGDHCTHDYRQDGGAETYEEAIIDIAKKVWTNYGNDRRVVDSEKWRKGDNDKS